MFIDFISAMSVFESGPQAFFPLPFHYGTEMNNDGNSRRDYWYPYSWPELED